MTSPENLALLSEINERLRDVIEKNGRNTQPITPETKMLLDEIIANLKKWRNASEKY